MSQFDKFKEEFVSDYLSIYDFMNDYDEKRDNDLVLIEDNSNICHDSYGNEESTLEKIFYSRKYHIFVKFSGIRESYNGEYWNDIVEVIPTEIKTTIYAEVNSNRNN